MSATNERRVSATRAVHFGSDVFGLDEIKKAAYRFTDRCAFEFRHENGEIICVLRLPPDMDSSEADRLEDAFRNEVLDQDLRRRIADETAPIRNAILAYAFSKTGIQE